MKLRSPKENFVSRDQQGGVGLIEVLIAVLILAVGILGLAQMQLSAKRASFEAVQRSIATSLARDILERMRSNPGELDAYAGLVTNLVVDDIDEDETAPFNCVTGSCNSANMAAYDIWDWKLMIKGNRTRIAATDVVAGGLLSPVVCLHNNAGTDAVDGLVTVVIAWKGVNEIGQSGLDDPGGLGLGECGNNEFNNASVNPPIVGDRLRRQLTMTTFITEV